MNLSYVITQAYSHFLHVMDDTKYVRSVFERYALEELNLPENEVPQFNRKVEIDDENEINSPEFDRFYIWYYLNYMAPLKEAAKKS